MFAVVLGVSAFAPAMATPSDNGDHKVVICHYQEAKTTDRDGNDLEIPIPEAYVVINIDKAGKMNGHFKNGVPHHFPVDGNGAPLVDLGDFVIDNVEVDNPTPEENDSVADCEALDAALPEA